MQTTSGSAASVANSRSVTCRMISRYSGIMFVKKLPEKPTNHTSSRRPDMTERSSRPHGTGPLGPESLRRPSAINSGSSRLTPLISAGVLRNQGHKPAMHHKKARPAITQNGVVQVPNKAEHAREEERHERRRSG